MIKDLSLNILSGYVDGRMSPARREAVRRHVASCPRCQKVTGSLTSYKTFLSHIPPTEESVTFDLRFRERLQRAPAKEEAQNIFEAAANRLREGLEAILLPRVPIALRVAASVLLIACGLYGYLSIMQPLFPSIVSAAGNVMVYDEKAASWREAKIGHKIGTNMLIVAKEGASVDMELSNRYAVRLKEGSKMKVAKLAPSLGRGTVSLELIEGRALVRIDKGFKGSRFIITTPSCETRAFGTKFAVDVNGKDRKKTWVGVLEGTVGVASKAEGEGLMRAKKPREVLVRSGQMTEVLLGKAPHAPQRLAMNEWRDLEELYQVGRKLQVILLVKNTPDRVLDVLRPAPLYISDEEPREIPELLEKALIEINEAIKAKDNAKHLEAIRTLERIVDEHPNPKYDPQLLLFIGAYYRYIDHYEDAVKSLKRAAAGYPDTTFASIAQCAIGIIYEEDLKDAKKAGEAYDKVLRNYPDSLEAIFLESLRTNGTAASVS